MRLPHIRLIEGKYRLVDNEELKPQKYNGFCIDLGGFESQLTAKRVIQVFRKACVSHFRDSEDRVWEVYLANLDRFCKEQGGQQDLVRALGAHTVALEDKRESEAPTPPKKGKK